MSYDELREALQKEVEEAEESGFDMECRELDFN